jgi:hypothetical protein
MPLQNLVQYDLSAIADINLDDILNLYERVKG